MATVLRLKTALFWLSVVVFSSALSRPTALWARPSPTSPAMGAPGAMSPLLPLPGTAAPHPAVVRIVVDEGGQTQSLGSGTLVDQRDDCGLVLTNWHVVRDAKGNITVLFPDGFTSLARVRKVDADWDLAALIIWRPRVAPVPLSRQAPRPGEFLTIAGYGSGNYRAATGRCTQFVSPGIRFPPEMVELSAEARQGDSGGPIFNDRGELAGVLFGASRGSTTGSHVGRVRTFLAAVIPPRDATTAPPVSTSPPLPVASSPAATPRLAANSGARHSPLVPIPVPRDERPVASAAQITPIRSGDTAASASFGPSPAGPSLAPVAAATRGLAANDLAASPPPTWTSPAFAPDPARQASVNQTSGGAALVSGSLFEQAKSILALIGLLAVVLRLAKLWESPAPSPPPAEGVS